MKYKFNIKPIIIEADSQEEAFAVYENGDTFFEVNDIEEWEI